MNGVPRWSRLALVATTVVHGLLALLAFVHCSFVWATWTREPMTPGTMAFDGPIPWWEHSLEVQIAGAAWGVLCVVTTVATLRLWWRPSRRVIGVLLGAIGAMLVLHAWESVVLFRDDGGVRLAWPLALAAWLGWLGVRWRRAGTTPPASRNP